ncbi:NagC family transcriptional regulator [Bifidobacterium aemilianum]|uniref:NagC family transcriptional regulator n=1 Tax=Bifidobacterium aemilianum TaxID=2493120 RepID=A0A366KBA9_9BIFI|nr:ROK family transcriptional regulator [Bifidobacterium aemilianum]RBP98532.1 NagC family transcriptional regulator [Bifidobacterium aemilianum]
MASPGSTISQASVSESNRSRILSHLYHHGVSSRAQIAKALDLTPAAITKITAHLIDGGLIAESQQTEANRRGRPIGLRLDKGRFHVVGVKFARSLVQIGVFDLAGKRISLHELPTVDESTIQRTIHLIHQQIEELLAGDRLIIAIGMAVPGPYLRTVGRTALVSSMQGWRRINLIREFGRSFSVPVFIEQDARAGALAEHLFSQGLKSQNMAYYLLGEGIGLGVVDQGRLVNGALGAASELGHISIDINGRPCDCGNLGCLEGYCSAIAVHQLIADRQLVPGAQAMTHRQACQALFDQAAAGDAPSLQAVKEIGRYVGYGCVTIINAFNPERIVIGDIVSAAGKPLLRAIQDVVDERVIPELNDSTSISLSCLPTDAIISGAAAVAITQFLNHPSLFARGDLSSGPPSHSSTSHSKQPAEQYQQQ